VDADRHVTLTQTDGPGERPADLLAEPFVTVTLSPLGGESVTGRA
jgi:hypothetical protein